MDSATEWRGGQMLLLRLATAQRRAGLQVAVACPEAGRLWAELGHAGVPRLDIPPGPSPRAALRIWAAGAALHVAHTSHAHGACAPLPTPLVVHRWVDHPPRASWKYRRPEAYAACTEAVARLLRAVGCRRVAVVPGGADPPLPGPPAPDAPDVIALGAAVPDKGHDVLAAAAAALPGLRFAVAGPGTAASPWCRGALRGLGLREDTTALLRGAQVLAQPSRREGLGMAVVEAMAVGTPVVASAVGGLPEVLEGVGILVPPDDPWALIAGIQAALALPPERRRAAQARAAARYSTAAMVEAATALYEAVLGRPLRRGPISA